MLNQAPSHGKNQSEKLFLHNTDVTFTGASADIVEFPVMLDKIEILALGIHVRQNSGAVGTPTKVQLDKTLKGTATRAILFAGSEVGIPANVLAPNDVQVSLDQAAVSATSGNLGKPNFPTAVKGDLLTLKWTQGVGGTQVGRPYFIYRKRAV